MNDMEYTDKEYCLEVWGDWACFTRPELKVERVSYDVITPSAARAIFEAILFKRYAMRWQITKIEVFRPIKWATIRRNEVGAVVNSSMKPIYIDDGKTRQQKNTLLLLDVRYRIYAKLVFIPVKDRPKEAFCQASAKCRRESYEVLSDVRTQGITRAMFYAALSRMS